MHIPILFTINIFAVWYNDDSNAYKGIMVHGALVVCDFMKVFMMRSILEVLLAQFSLYICSQKYLAVTFIDLIFLLVDIADRCNRPD